MRRVFRVRRWSVQRGLGKVLLEGIEEFKLFLGKMAKMASEEVIGRRPLVVAVHDGSGLMTSR